MASIKPDNSLASAYRASFRLYWRVCAVAVGVVLLVTLFVPYRYRSYTSIMPSDEKETATGLSALLQSSPLSLGSMSGSSKQSLVYAELLQSRSLVEKVVDSLKLTDSELFAGLTRDEIVENIQDHMDVETRKTGSVVITVEVASAWLPLLNGTAEQAREASARIANAARQVLDKLNRDRATTKARTTRAYIERVLARTKLEIDSLQGKKQEFQTKNKVIALDEQMVALVNNAVTIGTELATAELELSLAKQDFARNSPQIEYLEKKISTLKSQYDKVQKGGLVQGDEFSIPFNKVPALTRTYTNLLRDLKIKEQINVYLETQRMEQVIQEARDIPSLVVLDVAVPPKKRSSPPRLLAVIVTMLLVTLGFVIAVPVKNSLTVQRDQ